MPAADTATPTPGPTLERSFPDAQAAPYNRYASLGQQRHSTASLFVDQVGEIAG